VGDAILIDRLKKGGENVLQPPNWRGKETAGKLDREGDFTSQKGKKFSKPSAEKKTERLKMSNQGKEAPRFEKKSR